MPVKKGKSGRIARAMRAREPKVIEGAKQLLVIKGPNTSQLLTSAMKDLAMLKKPEVKMLQRKNDIRPFEDATSLEFLADKNDCAAFLYGSHNKKRPHNLVMGRLYDGHIYDMLELGITYYKSLGEHTGPKKAIGAAPLMVFAGEHWEREKEFQVLKNMLLDEGIKFRPYSVAFMAAEGRIPRVELEAMGPDMDLEVRRTHYPSADLTKAAHKVPKELTAKKVKNVTTDELGETVGRIHMQRQDFSRLELKKTKATKSIKRAAAEISKGESTETGAASRPAKKARTVEVESE